MNMEKRTLAEIETDIAQTKNELANVRGTETEVYARIVGYYRSVRNWNKGKRDEYDHRKMFAAENGTYALTEADSGCGCASEVPVGAGITAVHSELQPVRYELFARATCPNCPPVKEFLSRVAIAGDYIDADTHDGAEKAGEMGVFSAPTVILYDIQGIEIARAHTVQELRAVFEHAAVLC